MSPRDQYFSSMHGMARIRLSRTMEIVLRNLSDVWGVEIIVATLTPTDIGLSPEVTVQSKNLITMADAKQITEDVPKQDSAIPAYVRYLADATAPVQGYIEFKAALRNAKEVEAGALANNLKAMLKGPDTLESIQEVLNSGEWGEDTCDAIAKLMREGGYYIANPSDRHIAYHVCMDCIRYLAYDESPDNYDKDTQEDFFKAMKAHVDRELDGRKGHFSAGLIGETAEERLGYNPLSTQPCDLCRDKLHGARYGATLNILKARPSTGEKA